MNHLLLYPRPYPPNGGPVLPPLGLVGTMAPYILDVPYETRLDIINQIGDCTVEILAASGLPPGSVVWVDNPNQEVVIQWPPYSASGPFPLINGDFEDGDENWLLGPGMEVGAFGETGNGVQFKDRVGHSYLISLMLMPVNFAYTTTINARIAFGDNDNFGVYANVGLSYFDIDRQFLFQDAGPLVHSGSEDTWQDSMLVSGAPEDGYVQPFVRLVRGADNFPITVDNVTWDYEGTGGLDVELEVCLTLRITDSAHRTADWSGCVSAYVDPMNILAFVAAMEGVTSIEVLTPGGAWTISGDDITDDTSVHKIAARFGACVAMDSLDRFWYSTNYAVDWALATTPPVTADRDWTDMCAGPDGVFYLCGKSTTVATTSYIAKTTDNGVTWSEEVMEGVYGASRIRYAAGLLVVLSGSNGLSVNGIWTSPTGAGSDWTQRSTVSDLLSLSFNGTHWMAVGDSGTSYYAPPDAETWTYGGSSPGGISWSFLTVIGVPGAFVAGTNGNFGIYRSTDLGATWTNVLSGGLSKVGGAFGLDTVIFCDSIQTYFSHDFGATWDTVPYEGVDNYANALAFMEPA